MFCPKCGADAQRVESYCKRCGEWLPDIDALAQPRLFRKLTREEKIGKMRLLEAISAGLSLISATVILSVLTGHNDTNLLFLSVICCLVVSVYQMVNFYIGYKLQQRIDYNRAEGRKAIEAKAENSDRKLEEADTNQFPGVGAIVEHTTDILEPVPRVTNRD
jgi:hypothetical protein